MSRRTGPTPAIRAVIYERDGFACALCGGMDGPFAIHHRRARGAGGTRRPETNLPANLVLVCEFGRCHSHLEEQDRAGAYVNGWLVSQQTDPALVPFLYRGRWVLLSDMGAVEPTEVSA